MKAPSDSPNFTKAKVKSPAEMPGPDDKVTWARLAAYVDGEGCMGIYLGHERVRKNGKRPRYYTQILTVANQDRRLTDWLVENFGGGATPNGSKKRGRYELWQWRLNNQYLAYVLRMMFPYLLLKGEQAKLMLEYLDRPNHTVQCEETDRLCLALKEAKRSNFTEPRGNREERAAS